MSTMRRASSALLAAMTAAVLVAGCKTLPGPREFTPDGLERMPSRHSGGVFRLPGASFTQYRRVILEPVTVAFVEDWEKNHPHVSPKEIRRIRDETAKSFRDAFEREMIRDGKFTYANDPGKDVLVIAPTITDLDLAAAESDDLDTKTFSPRSVSIHVTADLRDASSNVLVGRVDMIAGGERYGMNEMRPVNRITNAFEIRNHLREWNQLLREAINVAKADKPRD
ncbi:MAG TPA: DUF3313 family protein [Steroidobacteraceae bacterium]|nr:DUF3313 family protein [Steroidobacteraceae bacterium]